MFSSKKINPRLLLAKLRKADYTHAGDEEAIDIFLKKINSLFSATPNLNVLDVGSGLGGTADYIRKKTSFNIYGIDIDATAIKHSNKYYPEIHVLECDVLRLDKIFPGNKFDLIYLFNVFYALPDQKTSLQRLSYVAKPGALLAIFDYTRHHSSKIEVKDLADKPMNPINLNDLKKWLKQTNWELIEIVDLSKEYEKWYVRLLENLISQKNNLLMDFTEEAYQKVLSTFSFLAKQIKNKEVGGGMIYAKYLSDA